MPFGSFRPGQHGRFLGIFAKASPRANFGRLGSENEPANRKRNNCRLNALGRTAVYDPRCKHVRDALPQHRTFQFGGADVGRGAGLV